MIVIENYIINPKLIKEKFKTFAQARGTKSSIYVNPTYDELREIVKEDKEYGSDPIFKDEFNRKYYEFRFVLDKHDENLFVFSGFYLTHSDICDQLHIPYRSKNNQYYFFGSAKLYIGERLLSDVTTYDKMTAEAIEDIPSWEFSNKYFNPKSGVVAYLNLYKKYSNK